MWLCMHMPHYQLYCSWYLCIPIASPATEPSPTTPTLSLTMKWVWPQKLISSKQMMRTRSCTCTRLLGLVPGFTFFTIFWILAPNMVVELTPGFPGLPTRPAAFQVYAVTAINCVHRCWKAYHKKARNTSLLPVPTTGHQHGVSGYVHV